VNIKYKLINNNNIIFRAANVLSKSCPGARPDFGQISVEKET